MDKGGKCRRGGGEENRWSHGTIVRRTRVLANVKGNVCEAFKDMGRAVVEGGENGTGGG